MCSDPQKAVHSVVIVDVVSRDRARIVDAVRERALAGARARAGRVERRDAAVGSAPCAALSRDRGRWSRGKRRPSSRGLPAGVGGVWRAGLRGAASAWRGDKRKPCLG